MKKKSLIILTILGLSIQAASWGPATHKYFCDNAVEQVWGAGVVKQCLPKKSSRFMDDFCELVYLMKDAQAYKACRDSYKKKGFIHPANIPDELFNDSELFHDYSHCPVRPGPARYQLCGDREDAPAPSEAQRWFNKAKEQSDTCMRVYAFCIGSVYYSKGENPLNQIRGETQDCYDSIVGGIDDKISSGLMYYRAGKRCEFENSDFEQEFSVSEKTIETILETLVKIGRNISSSSVSEEGKIILFANSIDYGLNRDFHDSLTAKGFTVTRATAENFQTLKYTKYVIILGGHNSPEGVGDVVSSVLNSDEKAALLNSTESKIIALRDNMWMMNQKVWVLAGYGKEQTHEAVIEFGGEVVGEVGKVI